MRRPLVVSVIGCYFFAAGIYLCAIATMMLDDAGCARSD
jgi:hypothetical protein